MLGDLLLKILEKRPKPLQTLLNQVRESNVELARLRLESGQAQAYIIRSTPTGPAKPREVISYVV